MAEVSFGLKERDLGSTQVDFRLSALGRRHVLHGDPRLHEVEILHRAIELILRHSDGVSGPKRRHVLQRDAVLEVEFRGANAGGRRFLGRPGARDPEQRPSIDAPVDVPTVPGRVPVGGLDSEVDRTETLDTGLGVAGRSAGVHGGKQVAVGLPDRPIGQ